jgi:DNA-binding transcriptional regulator YdaS (Cro superfamily)
MAKHLLNVDEVLILLEKDIERVGSQLQWAQQMGVDRTNVNAILRRRRPPTPQILSVLGLEVVIEPTLAEVIGRLRKAVELAGSQSEFARLTGAIRADVNSVLNGRRRPGPEIYKALELPRVVRYAPKKDIH